jgi:hypothetical protein
MKVKPGVKLIFGKIEEIGDNKPKKNALANLTEKNEH